MPLGDEWWGRARVSMLPWNGIESKELPWAISFGRSCHFPLKFYFLRPVSCLRECLHSFLCVCVDCVRVRWATLFFCCLWCSWNVNNRIPRMPARRASSLDSICFFFFFLLLLPLLPFSFLGMFCLFDFWRESEKKRMISSTKASGLDFRSLGNGTTPHRPSTHHRVWAAEMERI